MSLHARNILATSALLLTCSCLFPRTVKAMSTTTSAVSVHDVKINGVTSATAAYGVIAGNDPGLLALLNSDSVSSFAAGDPVEGVSWDFLGKSDAADGPFTENPGGTTGELTLADTLFQSSIGNVALSLKAGNNYAVYVFENVSAVNFFAFSTAALVNNGGNSADLSHASLFSGGSAQSVPEPSSMLLVGIGIVGLVGFVRKRRLHDRAARCVTA